ncbi:MAG TPA: hypothetical protein VFX33_01975 [Actinomycetales bacterium]|nr:hypothetical protein [Actinomycetales bacterium]
MTTADLTLLMYHQRHDELVRAAAHSALIREVRPRRSPRVRSSRVSVLDAVTGAWRRLTEDRSRAASADRALCCA